MILIPALDLMQGKLVRLRQGEPDAAKKYDNIGSPVDLALKWVKEGAEVLHIIDLDAALGRGDNLGVIREILGSLDIPIQLGGGIRTIDKARSFLNSGIYRIMVGSMAVREPEAVYKLLNEYGEDRVAVALDHCNGFLMINGWMEKTGITLNKEIDTHMSNGIRVFLVTSVERDGTLNGPDIASLKPLTRCGARIIAAGGVSSLEDLLALKMSGVYATVIGKALYEGCFTMKKALQSLEGT